MTNESNRSWLIEAWTDGASTGKVGPGGWAYILAIDGKFAVQDSGPAAKTTNQRMEMMGAIMALTQCEPHWKVKIYSDSAYLINGIARLPHWKANGWLTSLKEPVKNRDLWEKLAELVDKLDVEWIKVKGHVKNPKTMSDERNARADGLAVAAKKEAQRLARSNKTKS